MYLSLIIPTFNRQNTLLSALEGLQNQTLDQFEIIVVDNAADQEIKTLLEKFNQDAIHPAQYLPEPQLGLHNARHAGARTAKGEILVFTDDDATFSPAWLESFNQAFNNYPEMSAAGGPVRPIWEESPPQWLIDYMGDYKMFPILSLFEPCPQFNLDNRGVFFGVNMAIRRDALFEVGGFNPDSFGNIWLGDGETGLNRKLWENDMLVGYIPMAEVYHHISPSRMTIEYFRQRMANEGACDMYSLFHKRIPNRKQLLIKAMKLTIVKKFWIKSLFYRGKTDKLALDIQLNAARTQSQTKYLFRLIFDTDFRQFVEQEEWL